MKTIIITVKEKIATAQEDAFIVCGNSDIKASFVFDGDWDDVGTKTAVFICSDGTAYYVEMVDDCCSVPVLRGTSYVKVGVISSAVVTSTSALIPCKPAVTDDAENQGTIGQDQYETLCGIIDNRFPKGGTQGDILVKQSGADYDTGWESSADYCKKNEVYTKNETIQLLLSRELKREMITQASGQVQVEDNADFLLNGVSSLFFMCDESSKCNIMLTTASEGDVSVTFEGLTAYSGPDPADMGNGETWEFDILHGRCIGRKWA
ncbi:MAG: hypothetical protein IJB65_05640 [Clostridia bacterium]|nr:hypothetical protein [Clostridia bacterium]